MKNESLHDQKFGVCCAVSRNKLMGPMFLYDTLNSKRYSEVILHSSLNIEIRTKRKRYLLSYPYSLVMLSRLAFVIVKVKIYTAVLLTVASYDCDT
jgi:hypothetical protein